MNVLVLPELINYSTNTEFNVYVYFALQEKKTIRYTI
jgi:hypothetical protein